MTNSFSGRVYYILSDKPLVGIVSGMVSGLFSHEFIGLIGTYAGTTVALLSALVWFARVYDTYKPRCIKLYLTLKPRIVKMKNLLFLVVCIMAMLLFSCKTRHVVKSSTAAKSTYDTSAIQTSKVKSAVQETSTSADTGKIWTKNKTTVTATFAPPGGNGPSPGTGSAPGNTGVYYTKRQLENYIHNYLQTLSLTSETETTEQKGASSTSNRSANLDSAGTKQIKAGKSNQTNNSNTDIKSKPDYSYLKYVGIGLFVLLVICSAYYRVTHPRLGTIANFTKAQLQNG
jgi:hypothetical protein